MKQTLILAGLLATVLFSACDQRNIIDVYEINSTPNLSNPIVQKLTNVSWYRVGNQENEVVWTTTKFKNKASSPFETLLYSWAWMGMELHRDGTSTLLFRPPLGGSSYIFCQGKWKVSETEKNTIIIDTKIPVGYTNIKLKVENLEAKDNVGILTATMDFGDRVLRLEFYNNTSIFGDDPDREFPDVGKSTNRDWFSTMNVKQDKLIEHDYANTSWESIEYKSENKEEVEDKAQLSLRTLYVEDLLTKTPAFMYGLKFSFGENHKAYIQSPTLMKDIFGEKWTDLTEENYPVIDATWRVDGNRLIVETNELPFTSLGETAFKLIPDKTQTTFVPSQSPQKGIYVWRNFYYSFELVKQTNKGAWFRVTSPIETHYAFMLKKEMPATAAFVGIRATMNKLK